MLFTNNKKKLFKFPYILVGVHDVKWGLDHPVGYSALLVDQRVYKKLTSDAGTSGITINTLPVQVHNHCNLSNVPENLKWIKRVNILPYLSGEQVENYWQEFTVCGFSSETHH